MPGPHNVPLCPENGHLLLHPRPMEKRKPRAIRATVVRMVNRDAVLLGRLALHYKMISQEQAAVAATEMQAPGETRSIGEILLGLHFISEEQLRWLQDAAEKYLAQKQAAEKSGPVAAVKPEATAAKPDVTAAKPEVAAEPEITRFTGDLKDILQKAVSANASDIHLHSGAPIQFRVAGRLWAPRTARISAEDSIRLVHSVMTPEQISRLQTHHELDFAFTLPGVGRFRANVYRQQRGYDGVFRAISDTPPTLEQLQLPPTLERLTHFHQGLVLITGPAGCGKSSTLAALVNLINEAREDHILTVEDPIEFVHASKKAVVNQRQPQKHTQSFATALKAALREDPDIIVIGELRDLESISLAISAAETGHLVLATLHTNSAIRTINRVLDVFPPAQQSQIRAMVSESLRAVVTQRLVATADGTRRVPATEVLMVKPAVSSLIRDQKTHQIKSIMQTARAEGMWLLDDSLLELVKAGTVTKEEAQRHADDPRRFQ